MDQFLQQLLKIDNIEELKAWKEKIKSQVTQSHITWQKRMTLYKQVQLINEQIQKRMAD